MYSALKVNGKKLYELAREGKEVERKARRITIHEIRILEINLPEVKLEVTCSKGTYIRTLCHDIGQKLGCGGCMKELLRTRVERFGLEDSIRLGEIAQLQKEGILEEKIIAIDEMFPTYAQVVLPPKTAAAVRNGNSFRKRDISQETALKEYENDERVRVYDESHQFIAIYCYCRKDDLFKIVKMFFDGNEKK
jgi:tRNA pseudouridine55 synthase